MALESLPEPVESYIEKDTLKDVPGIGESVCTKIQEYLSTGKIQALEDLRKRIPHGLIEIMSVTGMGPKKAKVLYEKLNINNLDELLAAAKEGKIRNLTGFGKKSEENIIKGVQLKEESRGRLLLFDALLTANEVIGELKKNRHIQTIAPCGSLRRGRETIGDIDILCAVEKEHMLEAAGYFAHLPQVTRVLATGETKVSVITEDAMQIDLRIVDPSVYGAALQYFTGSKDHNVALRSFARTKGLTISEYGVFKIKNKRKPIAARTEEEVYASLGMQFIPAPMRENRGEIEAALKHQVPHLVQRKDIKGDTHIHSRYSDGANSIAELGERARQLGYEWIVSTDHSQSLKIAHGLSVETLHKKIREIRKFNDKSTDLKILCGVEIDILPDGSIDYPEDVLQELDFIVASVHSNFKMPEKQMTRRIIAAMENPYVNCIGHPTGRLINKREPYAVDMEEVLQAAKKTGTLVEINASPDRLDLDDIHCMRARELGVGLTIGTDSHSLDHFEYMALGITVAQRAWLTSGHLLNTLGYDELMKHLASNRRKVPA
jgi:DNA polymerase (family 10)